MLFPPSLRIAIGFLTRLPVPHAPYAEASFSRALGWFPLVGAALGGLLFAAALGIAPWFAVHVQAVLVVALWALLTGGLHLDGLADVADGWSGGRGDRERTLAIMRDPHIGAHGAAALSLFLLAKVATVAELCTHAGQRTLLLAPLLGRFVVVGLVVAFPYAREQGLGTAFRRHARATDWLLGSLCVAAALVWAGRPYLLPAALTALLIGLMALLASRRLGGLTGDVYGAAIELAELVFLLVCCVRTP